jgi:hypothetical protein
MVSMKTMDTKLLSSFKVAIFMAMNVYLEAETYRFMMIQMTHWRNVDSGPSYLIKDWKKGDMR